jgi:predicted PurR-regulated permease PerM
MGGNNLGGGVFNAQKRNNNNNNLEGQQWRAEFVDFVYSLISSLENVYIHTVGIFFLFFFCTSSSQQRAGYLFGMRSQKHQHATKEMGYFRLLSVFKINW